MQVLALIDKFVEISLFYFMLSYFTVSQYCALQKIKMYYTLMNIFNLQITQTLKIILIRSNIPNIQNSIEQSRIFTFTLRNTKQSQAAETGNVTDNKSCRTFSILKVMRLNFTMNHFI